MFDGMVTCGGLVEDPIQLLALISCFPARGSSMRCSLFVSPEVGLRLRVFVNEGSGMSTTYFFGVGQLCWGAAVREGWIESLKNPQLDSGTVRITHAGVARLEDLRFETLHAAARVFVEHPAAMASRLPCVEFQTLEPSWIWIPSERRWGYFHVFCQVGRDRLPQFFAVDTSGRVLPAIRY